jgi:hypothetical protein
LEKKKKETKEKIYPNNCHNPVFVLLYFHSREMKTYVYIKTYTGMIIAV